VDKISIMSQDGPDLDRHAFAPERLLDLSTTAVSYWDADLQCRYANRACADWFGVDPEILVDSCLEDLFVVLKLDSHFALADAALQGELRSVVQSFHEGLARRQGLVQYIPDVRRQQVNGLLLQVGAVPAMVRFAR
jgi:PAS domain-containing protein